MLGIIVLVLCGFFLYHYRPRNLETKFKRPLFWSEVGKQCFISQTIILTAFSMLSLIVSVLYGQLQTWMEWNNIFLYPFYPDPESIPAGFMFVFPIISAWLTHTKLVKSLSEEKAPNHSWFHRIMLFCVISLVGYFSYLLISEIAMGLFSVFGIGLMLRQLLMGLTFFSPIFIGVFAVEMSLSKLANCEVDNGNLISVTLP